MPSLDIGVIYILMINLTGEKFGKLVVLKKDVGRILNNKINNKGRDTYWICKCDCGKETSVRTTDLRNGNTTSCGCYRSESMRKTMKKYNTYDLSGEFGIGYTSSGEEFYFDIDDYDLIKDVCWYTDKDKYIVGTYNGKSIKQHRMILNFPTCKDIDHINHCVYDNRKSNIREATRSQNNQNKNSLGVYYSKSKGRWIAELKCDGKKHYLGSYVDIEDAILARHDAENTYFVEFKYERN